MDNSTILIVDDNQEIREIIEILLTGEGSVSYTHLTLPTTPYV